MGWALGERERLGGSRRWCKASGVGKNSLKGFFRHLIFEMDFFSGCFLFGRFFCLEKFH